MLGVIAACPCPSPRHRELVKDAPVRGMVGMLCCCCWSKPRAVVTVHLEDAHDLKKQDITGAGQRQG